MNAVSDDSVREQVVQGVKRSHVDFFVREIKFSKRLGNFGIRLVVVSFEEEATRRNLVELSIQLKLELFVTQNSYGQKNYSLSIELHDFSDFTSRWLDEFVSCDARHHVDPRKISRTPQVIRFGDQKSVLS